MKRVVVLASLVGAGLAITIAGTAQTPILAPAARIPIETGPTAVAIGDVTADGHPDVVIGYSQARTVRVLTGDGKGGLSRVLPPMTLAYPPSELALADVNEDGRLDLGISDHGNYAIDILLNDGAGRFTPAAGSRFAASEGGRPHTHGFALVDVNHDRHADILMGNNEDNTVAVLLGDGKSGFRRVAGSPFAVGPSPYPFGIADLDGDGALDLAVPSSGTGPNVGPGRVLTVLRGNGRGEFRPASGSPISVSPNPYFVAVGDVNGDARRDVITSHNGSSLFTVLLNTTSGFVPAPQSPLTLPARAFTVVTADVNRDGRDDIISGTGAGVVVLLGTKDGIVPAPGSPFRAGSGAWNIAIGDVNQDSRVDVAAIDFDSNSLVLLIGQPDLNRAAAHPPGRSLRRFLSSFSGADGSGAESSDTLLPR